MMKTIQLKILLGLLLGAMFSTLGACNPGQIDSPSAGSTIIANGVIERFGMTLPWNPHEGDRRIIDNSEMFSGARIDDENHVIGELNLQPLSNWDAESASAWVTRHCSTVGGLLMQNSLVTECLLEIVVECTGLPGSSDGSNRLPSDLSDIGLNLDTADGLEVDDINNCPAVEPLRVRTVWFSLESGDAQVGVLQERFLLSQSHNAWSSWRSYN